MPNIVNGGAIILVAVFGLVAVVGAADEFRELAGPTSSHTAPDAASAGLEDEPTDAPEVGTPIPGKHGLGVDHEDKRGDGERGRDRDDDRRHDDEAEGDGHDDEDDGDD